MGFNDYPSYQQVICRTGIKSKVPMQETMSNLGYLSTNGQVTPRRNIQYSLILNSFESLWLSCYQFE